MREILFRGKHGTEWVYGDLVQRESFILDRRSDCSRSIDMETLGQFVGLVDKNGERIFEGDIIRYGPKSMRAVIRWSEVAAGFSAVFENDDEHYQVLRTVKNWKIVGNIYDNPELFRVSK